MDELPGFECVFLEHKITFAVNEHQSLSPNVVETDYLLKYHTLFLLWLTKESAEEDEEDSDDSEDDDEIDEEEAMEDSDGEQV